MKLLHYHWSSLGVLTAYNSHRRFEGGHLIWPICDDIYVCVGSAVLHWTGSTAMMDATVESHRPKPIWPNQSRFHTGVGYVYPSGLHRNDATTWYCIITDKAAGPRPR